MHIEILLLIIIPVTGAFLIPLVDLINKKLRRIVLLLSVNLEFFLTIYIIINNYNKLKSNNLFLTYYLGGWGPPLGINLAMDGLGLLFSSIISFALLVIVIYSIGFIGHHESKYYVILLLFFGAMQGVVLTADIFNLYVFIELITITSTSLVAFKRNQNSIEAAIKYMIYGIIGGLIFLVGVILIYFNCGTLNMAEISLCFTKIDLEIQLIIVVFFMVSILIKLAIFPFHFWLPKAHSACPSSISALLSGLLLKVYVYIFIRVFWIVFDYSLLQQAGLANLLIYLALFSCLLGHIFALQADDIKRMLAFSTVGHVSMIISVLALNTKAGFYGGLMHIINHFLMKSTLFLGTGYLLQFTSSHKIKDLRGIGYKNKHLFITFIIAALGMMGIPPVNGFISKWYILLAFLEVKNYIGVIVVIVGSLTAVIYYFRFIFRAYKKVELKEPREESHIIGCFYREKTVIVTIYIFAGLVVFTGLFFKIFDLPLNVISNNLLNTDFYLKLLTGS